MIGSPVAAMGTTVKKKYIIYIYVSPITSKTTTETRHKCNNVLSFCINKKNLYICNNKLNFKKASLKTTKTMTKMSCP